MCHLKSNIRLMSKKRKKERRKEVRKGGGERKGERKNRHTDNENYRSNTSLGVDRRRHHWAKRETFLLQV